MKRLSFRICCVTMKTEQAPEVVSSREEKAVFDKTPQAQNTTTAKEKLTADKGTSERCVEQFLQKVMLLKQDIGHVHMLWKVSVVCGN